MSDQNAVKIAEFRAAVVAERARQYKKWGATNHEAAYWLAILMEDAGHVAEAIHESLFVRLHPGPVVEKLVRVAAVAEAAAVDLAARASLTISTKGGE